MYIASEISIETNEKTGFSIMDNSLENLSNMMNCIDFERSYWVVTNQYHDEKYIMKSRGELKKMAIT